MDLTFALFVLAGAVSQIAATALMLAAMRQRAFVVVTAWTKTEPVQVAVVGGRTIKAVCPKGECCPQGAAMMT